MPERKFKVGKMFLAGVAIVLLVVCVYKTIELSRRSTPPPLPNPNGYDDFVKAARLLLATEPAVGNPGDPSLSQKRLRELILTNAESLRLVKQGLSWTTRVPVEYSAQYLTTHASDLGAMKLLVHLLIAEGRLAEMEHRTNDAAEFYLEGIRYGEEAFRGGVMIDRLVGIACQALAMRWLQKAVAGLDSETCRSAIRTLRDIDRRQEPMRSVLNNEREWIRRTFSLWRRLPSMIPIPSMNPMIRAKKQFVANCDHVELELRQLMIDLAARAYELEHSQNPKNLNDLVPDYLDSIPTDPTTATNLTYLPHPP